MENEIVLKVDNISKEFEITNTARDGKAIFSALKDISFEVKKGDVISIIGNNGSGKTTLLKILSSITRPSSGKVEFYGSSTSILDIGNNFLPDLTGRENILLQLKINKKNKEEFDSYLQRILDFSEIGDFFDQPIKYYSSGMFLRLAFSLSFHVASDILILDEVLSVGDEGFRLKCQELLKKITASGKTILFVSHNRLEILELSNKCIWIEKGAIKKVGTPALLLGEYFAQHKDNFDGTREIVEIAESINNATNENDCINLKWNETDAPGNKYVNIREVRICTTHDNEKIVNTDAIILNFLIEKKTADVKIGVFFFIQDVFYQSVLVGHFLNNTDGKDISLETKNYKGLLNIRCTIPANYLMPGKYYLQLRFGMELNEWNLKSEELLRFPEKLSFTIYPGSHYIDFIGDLSKGSVRPKFEWAINKMELE